jgi:hypothetical protein
VFLHVFFFLDFSRGIFRVLLEFLMGSNID